MCNFNFLLSHTRSLEAKRTFCRFINFFFFNNTKQQQQIHHLIPVQNLLPTFITSSARVNVGNLHSHFTPPAGDNCHLQMYNIALSLSLYGIIICIWKRLLSLKYSLTCTMLNYKYYHLVIYYEHLHVFCFYEDCARSNREK